MITKKVYEITNEHFYLNDKAGSLIHGLIMEITKENATYLHKEELKPFALHLRFDADSKTSYLHISTLNETAKDIIFSALDSKSTIYLKQKQTEYNIKCIGEETTDFRDILNEQFLSEELNKKATINFLTPTTYKSNGDYLAFPQIKNIFINLYHKWVHFSKGADIYDKTLIDKICDFTKIYKYQMRSADYSVDSNGIISFKGTLTFKSDIPMSIISIRNALLILGKYSGMGSKTSLGMGGVDVVL